MIPDLAIAAVTLALKQRLQSALNRAGGTNGEVRTDSPDKITDTASPIANLFLYQVALNPFMLNNDLDPVVVRTQGQVAAQQIQTWQTPLDLDFILSFYGDERTLVPQRLMATCVAALHRQPVIAGAAIAAAAAAQFPDIDTTATPEVEDVKVGFARFGLDDIHRLWTVFKAPFALSVGYRVQVVVVFSASVTEPVDLVEKVVINATVPPQTAAAPQTHNPLPPLPPPPAGTKG